MEYVFVYELLFVSMVRTVVILYKAVSRSSSIEIEGKTTLFFIKVTYLVLEQQTLGPGTCSVIMMNTTVMYWGVPVISRFTFGK